VRNTTWKRLIAITMLQQQWHLTLALAGMAAKVMTTMALMPLYWTQWTGLSSVKIQLEQVMGNYDKMAQSVNHLTKDVLVPSELSKLTDFDKELRRQMISAEVKLNLVDIYKKTPNLSEADIALELNKRVNYTGANADIKNSIINDIVDKSSTHPLSREWISEIFSKSNPSRWWTAFVSQAKWLFISEQEEHARIALTRSENALNAVCLNAISEWKGNQWFARLASLTKGDMSEFIHNINRWQIIVNVTSEGGEAELKALKNVLKETPAGMQNLFSWLSLVLVGGVALHAEDGKKFETAMNWLKSMNPFYATWVLFEEGTKMKWHQWTNPQYLASMGIAGWFAWIEALSIAKNAREIGIIRAIGQSAVAPYKVIPSFARWLFVNTPRTISAIRAGGMTTALEHGKDVLRWSTKTIKWGWKSALVFWWIAAAVALPWVAFAYYDSEKMKSHIAELEKESLISNNGGANWDAIAEASKNGQKRKNKKL